MKNILLFLLLVWSWTGHAQWYVGAKGSATFSNYKTTTPWKEVSNMGFASGVSVYKQINTNLGYNIDLQYIRKGYHHKICNTITDKLEASYLEIPIALDYALPSVKNFRVHLNAGVYAAYWLSAKYKMEGFDASSEDFDFEKSKANRFDLGPVAGTGIEYILKKGSVLLDVRYELGLLDLQKTGNDDINNTNRALIIGLSYRRALRP
ncbi:MAG: porin family protein [Bacteroidota bacterium]